MFQPIAQRISLLCWIIFGLVLINLALFFGDYWTKMQHDLYFEPFSQRVSSVSDQFKDWQTYRNDRYAYEFHYPASWSFELSPSYEEWIFLRAPGVTKESKADIFISAGPEDLEISLEKWPGLIAEGSFERYNRTPIVIDGRPGVRLERPENESPYSAFYSVILKDSRIIDTRNNRPYGLLINMLLPSYGKEKSEEKVKIFDQILSTFKFIEPIDTSTWKTYRNEKYGFEFKYPAEFVLNIYDYGINHVNPPEGVRCRTELNSSDAEGKLQLSSCIDPWPLGKGIPPTPTLENYPQSVYGGQASGSDFKTGNVGGLRAVELLNFNSYPDVIFIELPTKIIIEIAAKDEKIFNQILATFKSSK